MQRRLVANGVWIAWSVVLVGGALVLAATTLTLTDPCADGGDAAVRAACEASRRAPLAAWLALLGTALAVIGGVGAVMTLVGRRSAGRDPGSTHADLP